MRTGSNVRRYAAAASLVAAAVTTAGCTDSSSPGLVLRPVGQPLPTHIDPLPRGLSTSPHSVSCRAATVAGSRPRRYSLLVTMQGFLDDPAKTTPTQHIVFGVRIHTSTQTYSTYLQDLDETDYEPPRVLLRVEDVSDQGGGFGYGGVYAPLATAVSKKALLAGRETNFTNYDPAITMTLDEPPTSCDIVVTGGYRGGQTIDIPLVP